MYKSSATFVTKCDVCVQILLYAPESGLIPLAQDYAQVSRDTNYMSIMIKRTKRDHANRSACVGAPVLPPLALNH